MTFVLRFGAYGGHPAPAGVCLLLSCERLSHCLGNLLLMALSMGDGVLKILGDVLFLVVLNRGKRWKNC